MKPTEFKVIPNGPILVKGNFTIICVNGKTIEVKDEAYMCRCGASQNKPFCDSSHKRVGVKD